MAITREQMHGFPQGTHRYNPLLRVGSLIIVCFLVKLHESWIRVTLLLGFGLGFDHKESTETHSDLNRSPHQWQKTHNYVSHAVFLKYLGTCKNNTSVFALDAEDDSELQLYKNRYLPIIIEEK
jgi:hypothetical protein